jgi:hypothetical protein
MKWNTPPGTARTTANPALVELFQRRPEEFVRLFRAYISTIPPNVYFPGQEACRYHQWRAQTDADNP